MECVVHRVRMRHPGDVSGVLRLIGDGRIPAESIAAIFGKTEGNGCVNDFTRGYALSALSVALAPRLGIPPMRYRRASRWSCRAARKAGCRRTFSSSRWCAEVRRAEGERPWRLAPL